VVIGHATDTDRSRRQISAIRDGTSMTGIPPKTCIIELMLAAVFRSHNTIVVISGVNMAASHHWKAFLPLDSNPDVCTVLAHQLGGDPKLLF
jgi:hypothetical protein